MRVEALMTRTLATCRPNDTLDCAARIMWDGDCGCVPVVQGNGEGPILVGMLTDRDVCMAAYTQGGPLAELRVSTAMARAPRTCGPRDTVAHALTILQTNQLHRLPVVDEHDHLVGMLTLADIAREAARETSRAARDVTPQALAATLEAISAPRSRRDLVPAA